MKLELEAHEIPPHLQQFFEPVPALALRPKNALMIPARVAIALQDDGWYLRQEITWCKKSPMPESVTDRATSATEKIYHLSKSPKYFYDQDAVREPCSPTNVLDLARRKTLNNKSNGTGTYEEARPDLCRSRRDYMPDGNMRNQWNYWVLSSENCSFAHFATFPSEIPRRCIKAGSRPGDIVLEPFAGSGTVGQVAIEQGRRGILIELNEQYLPIISKRLRTEQPVMFAPEPEPSHQMELIALESAV